jgi:hypothetical protein
MIRLAICGLLAAVALTVAGAAQPLAPTQNCPRGALPLVGANPLVPASRVTLARESREARAQVQGAIIAWSDPQRGGPVKHECGATIAKRTVVVYVLRLALLPSQSLAQGVYYVSRFSNGYRIWEVAH